MAITRWEPFRELEDMAERLNRVFGRSDLGRVVGQQALTAADWSPAVDVLETPDEYLIKAELPEVKKEDIKVSAEQGMLSITGERKQEKEEKNKKFHRVERVYGSFMRTFSLPDDVDESKLKADFKDGILAVHLPKSGQAKPKSVEVKVN